MSNGAYPAYPKDPEDIIGYCRNCTEPFRRKDSPDACACGCIKASISKRVNANFAPDCTACDHTKNCRADKRRSATPCQPK
jgi:hypothetical protein